MKTYTTILLGNNEIGKTVLMNTFENKKYCPLLFSKISFKYRIMNRFKDEEYVIYDSNGSCQYDDIRNIFFESVNYFVICYSVYNKESFIAVTQRWISYVYSNVEHIPIIYVIGLKNEMVNYPVEVSVDDQIKLKAQPCIKEVFECDTSKPNDIELVFNLMSSLFVDSHKTVCETKSLSTLEKISYRTKIFKRSLFK
ncbi:cell division control protein 42, putative [Entamoeba histolytica HM-1:IMSS-B]|uniref:small monomeric GTPase n=6 Tax=Entamoeba histolytica TaxID=5759 RepID=C4M591_ENTH1|nr:cell division control protein 42, putative [Entamoeba histolytica HM-1:IMSS]EMD43460.1 cell division control protein, putative [Entamoeba histolytica KU27]EMH76552.1 cell division control protein 42, putative [Entamoeba histolytica HM-1:IMSS-B]EMS12610.1 cell division control protein 42, putative [Entamoeba histolytica HM-3:IMSS]ENY60822.1 cell division control protein 42, putative [Entamoeba histolytica HM-1:IMSS-A]GAT96582.1 cell division control protein 42 putative [Entamoeba histolytica|eukprot:XP_650443.1 cell division control protein 42, putative [Entamoeba histolytica HM-1:IMSS]